MDQKDEIKQKLDIVDVIGSYVPLKKSGRNYKAVCPFHTEKTPSFMVSPELQIYKCFGCGASGDIYTFIQEIEGVDFSQALEQLAERAGIKLVKKSFDSRSQLRKKIYFINELTSRFYSYLLLQHQVGKRALSYLKKDRGLKKQTIEEFSIGYAPNSWDMLYKFLLKRGVTEQDMITAGVVTKRKSGNGCIDKFRGRIIFPLIDVDGKIVGFTGRTIFNKEPKYLNTSETPVFHKTSFIFGLGKNKVNIKKEGAVFVEGQMDLISAWQSNIKNLVTVSGTSLTENQLRILSRYTNDVTFCFDSDFAGVSASSRAISLAERQSFNIKLSIIPEPYKDLDELIFKDLPQAKRVLKDSVSAYDFLLFSTIKKYSKSTAIGKKKIMEDLIPVFSKITNQVLLDHYAKEISSELDLELETVYSMFRKETTGGDRNYEFVDESNSLPTQERKPEAHFIALILKLPLEDAQNNIGKLKDSDFLSDQIRRIFGVLKNYLKGRKTNININSLLKKLDKDDQILVSELFMWDIEGLDENELDVLSKDTEATIDRIKKLAVKRDLKELTEKIKVAEKSGDSKEVEKLSKKFEKLSKGLI